jgi:hypothetical protein
MKDSDKIPYISFPNSKNIREEATGSLVALDSDNQYISQNLTPQGGLALFWLSGKFDR